MTKKFYITTAIDYANAPPHLGHAYEKIAADVLARWNRNIGNDVFFLTGIDEHGQKVKESAIEKNKTPKDFVDELSKKFSELTKKFNISNNFFIRTTNIKHKIFVQKMLQKAYDNGDIYKDIYDGFYCVGCERYYDDKEAINGNCPIHLKKLERKKEENYFFRLSKYEKKILDYYKKNSEFISPKFKQKEILNRVNEGLRDISISRQKKKLDWGIELPFDHEHVNYVWFDALFNYMSALQIENKIMFWPCDVHIVGHDISWFHLVYWPAFLMSVGYDLPKKVFSHGMILDNKGHKMSKSLGNVVNPYDEIEKYGLDEIRYILLSLGTFGEDLNYSKEIVVQKINNELNNDLGNLVSRVHAMTTKYFPSGIEKYKLEITKVGEVIINENNFFELFNSYMQNLDFNRAIELLWNRIRNINAYINEVAPWKETSQNRLANIISILNACVVDITQYLDCFMPNKAELIREQFNIKKELPIKEISLCYQEVGHKLGEKKNIFEKVKLEEGKKNEEKSIIIDKFYIKNKRNKKIYCELFSSNNNNNNNNNKLIIFVHGFCSNRLGGESDMLKNKFLEKGYNFFRFDFCGSGKSDFDTITIEKELEDLNLILDEINTKYNYSEKTLFGNSLGGLLSLQAKHKGLSKLILNGPVTTPITKEKYFKRKLYTKKQLDELEKTKCMTIENIRGKFVVEEKIFHEREKLDKKKLLGEIEIPVFILQGDNDKLVLLNDTIDCNKYNSNIRIEVIKGGVHSLNDYPKNLKTVWIKKFFEFLENKEIIFSSLNLKVGKIIETNDHPSAEKLYIEKIDVGEDKPRQIISGLKDYYKKEELLGKKVVVVANLKPAKLRGEISQGMILAADDKKKVGLIYADSKIGENLTCKNKKADNSTEITIDDFFKIKLKSNGTKILHNNCDVEIEGGKLIIDKKVKGSIR